ncbi:polyprenol monophosphomannose synthase [Corynebacterium glaucum]|uniref:polyprenol monophosphomannose synthase n=1 Tax=Corynebacterium glaucum TaxID=187491 RepID=UPI00265B0394|nr:polyprenol monophosphomannose synthase [Corynebacterium glaucum]
MSTTLVIIPTYNEVENLPLIVGRVLDATPEVDVLVVDDNSPDGTGEKADELANAHPEVHVLHRGGKEGLLAAYRAGFRWGLEREYEVICQMDADGSHAPEELELLLDEIAAGADLVIGSRYVEGGEVKNWPQRRLLLSKFGNRYIALALGEDVLDMTAGYRAMRREVLEGIDLDALSSKGYIFQAELAYRAINAGFDVREVPVTFEDRKLGKSKLDASFAAASLTEVTKWGVADKASKIAEMAKQMSGLARYEYDYSGLPKLGQRISEVPEAVVNMVSEFSKLAKHEMQNSRLFGNRR